MSSIPRLSSAIFRREQGIREARCVQTVYASTAMAAFLYIRVTSNLDRGIQSLLGTDDF